MTWTWREQAAQLCLVLGFCGAVFNYVVIRPLNTSIQNLGEVVNELREYLRRDNERLNQLEGKVKELSYALQKAHDRIDEFLHKGAVHREKA